jgi:hypothetical protein
MKRLLQFVAVGAFCATAGAAISAAGGNCNSVTGHCVETDIPTTVSHSSQVTRLHGGRRLVLSQTRWFKTWHDRSRPGDVRCITIATKIGGSKIDAPPTINVSCDWSDDQATPNLEPGG